MWLFHLVAKSSGSPTVAHFAPDIQSGSKTCHSTKKFPGINIPKYIISISTRIVASFSAKRWRGDLLFSSEKVRKQGSKKVRWTPKFKMLVRKKFGGHQSSKRWFEKSSGGQTAPPEFENKVRKKFGGKKSSKCWFEKSSGGQTALPEFENKVRKKFGEKKFEMLVRKKFGGPNCSARVRKHSSKKVRWKKKKFEMLV